MGCTVQELDRPRSFRHESTVAPLSFDGRVERSAQTENVIIYPEWQRQPRNERYRLDARNSDNFIGTVPPRSS